MKDYGFVRVTAAVPKIAIGNVEANLEEHFRLIREHQHSDIIVFPELSLTGYSCGDLFGQRALIDLAWKTLTSELAPHKCRATIVVGIPVFHEETGGLYNCAAVINDGRLIGIVPKSYVPNYREFYEGRWFVGANGSEPKTISDSWYEIPFGTDLLFKHKYGRWIFGVEICEDVWAPIPPSSYQALAGATILLNLSASNETVGKSQFRREFVKGQTGKLLAAYVYCSAGPTESTSDLVFGGHCMIGENGNILLESDKFIRNAHAITTDVDVDKLRHERAAMPLTFTECARRNKKDFRVIEYVPTGAIWGHKDIKRKVSAHPFVPSDPQTLKDRCEEIFGDQVCGLAKRVEMLPSKDIYIGISGGLDSTIAALVATKAYDLLEIDRKHIHGITMPGFGTTAQTKDNAEALMRHLKISQETIDIRPTALLAFEALAHKPFGKEFAYDHNMWVNLAHFNAFLQEEVEEGANDLVFENVQARLRTFYLMSRGFVLGTGDLSEIALGWCTYCGDHMSMYNVNCSIPKTLIKFLVEYVANNEGCDLLLRDVLLDIAGTIISPELLPTKGGKIAQSTEDKLGPYEVHDFYMYHLIRNGFSPSKILQLAQIAFRDKYDKDTLVRHIRTFITRFFINQFKRDCVANGPKVGSVSLSPRGDWRMPSDADRTLWLQDVDKWAKGDERD